MTECNWCKDEICVNADCPICCDYCPVPDTEGVCKFEDRSERHFTVEGLTMTKEYIEREALIARYDAEHVGPPGRARELMATAPAADVVEVVRCIDCRYCISATADNAEYELCVVDDDVFPVSVQKQHFCGRGKRKEE